MTRSDGSWGGFFVRRPVFAAVCSLLIMVAGIVSVGRLPVDWYPNLAPPQVQVISTYLGADAETVETNVTTPIEQEINGVEGMSYLRSDSTSSGVSTITVTFDLDRDPDVAAVDVQNKVNRALPKLPGSVRDLGVTVEKTTSTFIMGIGLFSESGDYDGTWLSNYADRFIKDRIKRVEGVSDVRIFGERKFAMRLWLDPLELAARRLTTDDVVRALQSQNLQVGAGQLGQPPNDAGQEYQLAVQAEGRLPDADGFAAIVVATGDDGQITRLSDVARIELGAENYATTLRFDGREAVGLGIVQQHDANALEVKEAVLAELEEMAEDFPPGIRYETGFDATVIIEDSIREVVITLFEAIALVVLVIFVFLGKLRSTLIPAVAVPVSLVGTFFFADMMGFSLNTLTLFGLTLATGLVVDDSIVVLENVERVLEEEKVSAAEAAQRSMKQIFGAVVAMTLVTCAVFVPVAFFPGTTGVLYQQFALTIVFSVGLSAFVSLTLTPALCALILRTRPRAGRLMRTIDAAESWLLRNYLGSLEVVLRHRAAALVAFVVMIAATVQVYRMVPTGFIPADDQGYIIVAVQAPPGASLEYTSNAMRRAEAILQEQDEVLHTFAVGGFGFTGSAPNRATIFVPLKPFADREGSEHGAEALIERIRGPLWQVPDAMVMPFMPPPVRGLGNLGGFQLMLLDTNDGPPGDLASVTGEVIGAASQDPTLTGMFTGFSADDPQMFVRVDRERAESLEVGVDAVYRTIETMLGSRYINDFTLGGRSYRVYAQADSAHRRSPQDIEELYVRSRDGALVPIGALVSIEERTAPPIIHHYDLFRSVEINGGAAPGRSSGEAIAAIDAIEHSTLGGGYVFEWTGLTREEIEASGTTLVLLALGGLVVFLVLAAQFESFRLPAVVMLTVPPAGLGALLAQWSRGLGNDVFAQIGLLLLIGLASRNAILIVEFAQQQRERGMSAQAAVLEAARMRLRPILMTAVSFLIGILPLMLATGASALSRQSLGTAVFGGMLASVVVSLYVTPLLYVLVERNRGAR
jgi:HAE1 family hydrophobic/amphiphilic exporter-1